MQYASWDQKKYDRLHELLGVLKRNRSKVPLQTLKTRYAESYGKLTSELSELADWLILYWFGAIRFPEREDAVGTDRFRSRINAIWGEETRSGGLRDAYRSTLIDKLDYDGFLDTAYSIRQRMDDEAFAPYVAENNVTTGNGIHNAVFRADWSAERHRWERGKEFILCAYAPTQEVMHCE